MSDLLQPRAPQAQDPIGAGRNQGSVRPRDVRHPTCVRLGTRRDDLATRDVEHDHIATPVTARDIATVLGHGQTIRFMAVPVRRLVRRAEIDDAAVRRPR